MLAYGFFGMGKTTAAEALRARGIDAADVDEELFRPHPEDFPEAALAADAPGRIVFVNGYPPSVERLRPAVAFLPESIEDACARLRGRGVPQAFADRLLRHADEIMAWFRTAPFGRVVWLKPGGFVLDHAAMLEREAAAEAAAAQGPACAKEEAMKKEQDCGGAAQKDMQSRTADECMDALAHAASDAAAFERAFASLPKDVLRGALQGKQEAEDGGMPKP